MGLMEIGPGCFGVTRLISELSSCVILRVTIPI
jgi:hypothetical protein